MILIQERYSQNLLKKKKRKVRFISLLVLLSLICIHCRSQYSNNSPSKNKNESLLSNSENVYSKKLHDILIALRNKNTGEDNFGSFKLTQGKQSKPPTVRSITIDGNQQTAIVFPLGSSLEIADYRFTQALFQGWLGWSLKTLDEPSKHRLIIEWIEGDRKTLLLSTEQLLPFTKLEGWHSFSSPMAGSNQKGFLRISSVVTQSDITNSPGFFALTFPRIIELTSMIGYRTKNKPNLVLITLDTTRKDHINCFPDDRYGVDVPYEVQTPGLDKLASESILLTNATTPISSTGPAHVSLMTGLYPLSTGVHKNGIPLHEQATTLAEQLLKAGYETGAFVSGYSVKGYICGLHQGFCYYDDLFSGPIKKLEQKADVTISKVVTWLNERESPYFLWVHLFDPHFQYSPPPPFRNLYDQSYRGQYETMINKHLSEPESIYRNLIGLTPRDIAHGRALYAGEVTYMDSSLGNLFYTLEHRTDWQNTIVCVVADHGEYLGEHGHFFHHNGITEQLLRIPMMIRIPGRTTDYRSDPVSLIDLFPTFLDLLGIDSRNQAVEGVSIADLIKSTANDHETLPQRYLFSEFIDKYSIRSGDWKYTIAIDINDRLPNVNESIIIYKYLYNLKNDPYESDNLINDTSVQQEKLNLLHQLLSWLNKPRNAFEHTNIDLDLEEQIQDNLQALGYLQ